VKTLSVYLDKAQTYSSKKKIAKVRVYLLLEAVLTHMSGLQVVKVKKKQINILQAPNNSQSRNLKYSSLNLNDKC
jgi:hypothetical protein